MSLYGSQDNKFTQIKSFRTASTGQTKFIVSAEKFAKYEKDLFDLLGIQNTPFKLDSASTSQADSKNLHSRSNLVQDMTRFEADFELNALNQVQQCCRNSRRELSKLKNSDSLSDENKFRSKVISVVLNQPTRPRRAGRILLTKKNSASLDSVLSEIGNMFKAHSVQIRKLFNLRGVQVFFPWINYFLNTFFILTKILFLR